MMASLQSTTRVELVWLHLCMSYLVKVLCSWGERRFCYYFRILMEQRFVSICFYRDFFGEDTDLQLVFSQAAIVDNRRTKLFEKSVYALIVCPLILDL
ncbi:unnamed protein product [Brassica rapa subsp. trilocularis]